jgi:GH25 family lysozyme M1 (1,4-beta-N-acetylmuramidase)
MAEAGFDASAWQGGAYSGGGGFTFGLAKLTEGVGFKDPAADRHMAAILAQPIVPGGYHFGRPDLNAGTAGAYAEADWFWRVATSYGGARGMLLALDAESAGGSAGWCDDFAGRLSWRLGGYNPLFYSYWAWMLSRGLVGAEVLTYAPLWLAWPDANGPLPGPVVSMQQYGLTSVPGIAGSVDANRFFGSLAQLRALTIGAGSTPNVTPGDPPMASGACITIGARTIVAALGQDGQIGLASSEGGLGGLEAGTYLTIDPYGSSDVRDVWLGQDTGSDGEARLLVFAADGEGSVYGAAYRPADWKQLAGWAIVAGWRRYARVPVYQGEVLSGLQGPPGPPGKDAPPVDVNSILAEAGRRLSVIPPSGG